MTQLSIRQVALFGEAVDPLMHFALLAGILLLVFEVAVLLGDLAGGRYLDARKTSTRETE